MQLFARLHPAITMGYFVLVIGSAMVFHHPILLLCALAGAWVNTAHLIGRMPLKLTLGFLPVILVTVLINGFFSTYGVTTLFTMPNGNAITLEGFLYGAVLGCSFLSIILWFMAYQAVMTSDRFLFLFSRFLPALSQVLSMALQFVPRYSRQADRIRDARAGLGLQDGDGSRRARLRQGTQVFSILTSWALENAIDTADAMRARGYGAVHRTTHLPRRLTRRDTFFALAAGIPAVIFLIGVALGASKALYDPVVILAPMVPFNLFSYICYGLLCLLPTLFDLWGGWLWHRSRSAI